jgi:UDP-N-acetylmuramate dehydrogenase
VNVQNDISLKPYNTFGIDVKAKYFISISSVEDLKKVFSSEKFPQKFILGGGSNMLLTKDIDALVIHLNLKGKTVIEHTENEVLVQCQAGENWHEFVLWRFREFITHTW